MPLPLPPPIRISRDDLRFLSQARDVLERPSLSIRLTHALGSPVEKGFHLLPKNWMKSMHGMTHQALTQALRFSLLTLDPKSKHPSRNFHHKLLAAGTGGVGGAFGLVALPIELPLSTIIMLRSIADIARSEGENLRLTETRLACLEVFALGGSLRKEDQAETAYYATRAALASAVSEAAAHIARKGLTDVGSPPLLRLVSILAARFGVTLSERAAAMAIPIAGAVGGALINSIFMDHFQNVARGHFIIRRLERVYGQDRVKQKFLRKR